MSKVPVFPLQDGPRRAPESRWHLSGKLAVLESTHSKWEQAAKRCSMSTLTLVDQNGRPLTNDKPISPSPDVVELSLDQLAELEARKQSTKVVKTR